MGETHTHTNTRARAHSTHVKLRILTGRAGPPATQPVPTAGRTEAGKGVCVFEWDLHRVFGANKG